MRKVTKRPPPGIRVPVKKVEAPATPITKAITSIEDPFTNGKEDVLRLTNKALDLELKQLQGDARTFAAVIPTQDVKVLFIGTARSGREPGANGFQDYVHGEQTGAEMRILDQSLGSGGGGGGMEGPLAGHARMDALLDMQAGRTVGWEAGEPTRVGSNIVIATEQKPNKFITKEKLASFETFLFRMEALFRRTSDFVSTPGGYGTVAELFAYLAMKEMGLVGAPMAYSAPDEFYDELTAAFAPLLTESERRQVMENHFRDPKKVAEFVAAQDNTVPEVDLKALAASMRDDLERGYVRLDGQPQAISFIGGTGERAEANAQAMAEIAAAETKAGNTLRLGGSPTLDQAVLKAARKVDPNVEIQGYALDSSPVHSEPGVEYMKVKDNPLVLRQLLNANTQGIVLSPDGALQIAMLFMALTDIQTGKMPKVPIVVLDPDGKFEAVMKVVGKLMLTKGRKYIDPRDLGLLRVINDPKEASRYLNANQEAPASKT